MANLTMKNITDRLSSAVRVLMRPVLREFNFFLAVWLINSSATLVYLVGCFYLPHYNAWVAVRCLALGTFIAYLLALILHMLRPRWARITYKALCYTVLLILEVVYVFIALNFNMTLGPRVLILLAETNAQESAEFIKTYFLSVMSQWAYVVDVVIFAAVTALEWQRMRVNKFACSKRPKIIIAALILPLMLYGACLSYNYVKLALCKHSKDLNHWEQGFSVNAFDHVTGTIYSLCYINVGEADINQAIEVTRAVATTPVSVSEPDSLNVVLVLGESYIKSHCALYGYEHNTTPHMIAERDRGNLIVFTDIIAPYNSTYQVEKNCFALNDMSSGEMWYEKPIFPVVFKHAGFKVFFWDNQRNYANKELFTITVNAFIYNDIIKSLSYNEISTGKMDYDGNLITNFQNASKVPPGKYNLYIFHLMGQHVHPQGRYPEGKGFDVFNADSVKRNDSYLDKDKRTYIAQYDNATYYNDAVMKRIFDMWRYKNTVVVYFPDHGDEAYDYRDHCGRHTVTDPDAKLLHCQNDVPFVVWCSDYYIAHHQELYNQLKVAATRQGMIQDANQLLLRLAGINTPYYLPQRDISSPKYKPQPRIVYGRYNYDEIVK